MITASDTSLSRRLVRKRFNRNPSLRPKERPLRIALTGGPGGGKSTAAAFLSQEFHDELWVLPEAATMLYSNGFPRGRQPETIRIVQRCIYNVQRSMELAAIEEHGQRMHICDRATIDGAAYWPDGPEAFFAAMGTTREDELSFYDAVIFMHTAATLPGGYQRDISIRTEERDQALELNDRVRALYDGHPNLIEIGGSQSFLDKIEETTRTVRRLLHAAAAEARYSAYAARASFS